MPKTILLARPHPFIVTKMKPFLEQNGFQSRKLDKLVNLPLNVSGLSGAIISLAVESPVSESVETVFHQLRQHSPNVPILFAAMLNLDAMAGVLRRLAKSQKIDDVTILGMDETNKDHPDLGQPNTFLYISNGDLSTPEKHTLASRIMQCHFR